ncbi:hypothetical protein, partial [Streptomyces sp. NPDC058759]|uniref:hypothetical protein n=1 Tax=Streptomyces sp. NPDC058759 TaxID=3346628 RepID=UPI0036A4A5C1
MTIRTDIEASAHAGLRHHPPCTAAGDNALVADHAHSQLPATGIGTGVGWEVRRVTIRTDIEASAHAGLRHHPPC